MEESKPFMIKGKPYYPNQSDVREVDYERGVVVDTEKGTGWPVTFYMENGIPRIAKSGPEIRVLGLESSSKYVLMRNIIPDMATRVDDGKRIITFTCTNMRDSLPKEILDIIEKRADNIRRSSTFERVSEGLDRIKEEDLGEPIGVMDSLPAGKDEGSDGAE